MSPKRLKIVAPAVSSSAKPTVLVRCRTSAFAVVSAVGTCAVVVLAVTALSGSPVATATTSTARAAVSAPPQVEIVGHGWGHGRGLSQYGALGYAKDQGWSREQILGHYYSNTSAGSVPASSTPDPDRLRVELLYMSGRQTTVSLGDGAIELVASDGSVVATSGANTNTVTLIAKGSEITARFGSGCDGPWERALDLGSASIRVRARTEGTAQANLLQVCGPSFSVWYDGDIVSTISNSQQRTTNIVTVDQYLRGVVPNEVPASWPATVLEVQAIAARSYVLAGDQRFSPVADTCDTTRCQVYDGRFTTRGGWRRSTQSTTDDAVKATSGMVRTLSDGKIARTEFSSSSGGYTAGGDFPAVPDDGDAVADNPNSTWTTTVNLSSIEKQHDLGRIAELAIVERNRLGRDGGRVLRAEYRFERGTVEVSGDDFRRAFGLKSNWFTPGPVMRGGVATDTETVSGGETSEDVDVSDTGKDADTGTGQEFVKRTFERLQGREPTASELDQWSTKAETRTGKRELATELVDTEYFAGVLIDDLYETALARSSDDSGRAYWIQTMKDGFAYEQVGVHFYGSDEYFTRMQRSEDRFVVSLYRNILGREPDAEGRRYWNETLAQDAGNVVVAESFYRSVESRRDRSRRLYERVLDQNPNAEQVEALASRLLEIDDLALAAEIAVSEGADG